VSRAINGHEAEPTLCGYCQFEPAIAFVGRPICLICSYDPTINPSHAFRSFGGRLGWFWAQYQTYRGVLPLRFLIGQWLACEMRVRR
jgi:hypothetical protein